MRPASQRGPNSTQLTLLLQKEAYRTWLARQKSHNLASSLITASGEGVSAARNCCIRGPLTLHAYCISHRHEGPMGGFSWIQQVRASSRRL